MARPYFLQGAGSTNKTLVQKNLTKVKGWYGFNTDATLANVIYTGNILLKGSIIQG